MANFNKILMWATLAVWAVFSAVPAVADEHYVFMDEPLAPYSLGEIGGLAQGGISNELLKEVLGRLDATFTLRLVPWARALKSVEHGAADGMPLLMKDEEREAFMAFSDPVLENSERFYYLTSRLGHFQWTEFSDLAHLKLGLVNGYTYSESFKAALEEYGFQTVYSQDVEANLNLLLAGRVDLILEDESLVTPLLQEHSEWAARVAAAEKPVASYYWYIGISMKSPLADRMDEINQALEAMRLDGSLDSILDAK